MKARFNKSKWVFHKKQQFLLMGLLVIQLGTYWWINDHYAHTQEPIIIETIDTPKVTTREVAKASTLGKTSILKRENPVQEEKKNTEVRKPASFHFNPNNISEDSLWLLGIDMYTASNWIKYLNKGGRFSSNEDVRKIYGITEKSYARIDTLMVIIKPKYTNAPEAPSIHPILNETRQKDSTSFSNSGFIDSSESILAPPPSSKPVVDEVLIDINTADEVQLQYIRGIGPSFASRIVKYRRMLGGFHKINQLQEVYGLDREKFLSIRDQVTVSNFIQPININEPDPKKLSKHPYINYQEGKLISAYYRQHGDFSNVEEILHIGVMDNHWLERVKPYLTTYKAQVPPISESGTQPINSPGIGSNFKN